MTVLFVDDDQDDVDLFCEALKEIDKSIICLTAHNGIQALKILTADLFEVPDYIFLDINMPLMDGIQCLEQIRKENRLKDINVTMYTTSKDPREYRRCIELGADYLVKPANYSTLLSMLKERLGSYSDQ
ncbi:MAG TPA: response regulator [Ohtaekwangia sp.]|nr:response regulator [Ohtaekwangia sp.]